MDERITRVYELQQGNRWNMAATTAAQRIERLKRLRDGLWARRSEIHQALYQDFGKNPAEADLTELLPVLAEIKHTIEHLARWMKPRRVGTPRLLLGTRSEIRYEPKGLVLILSPWNYPLNLLLNPLVATIAAGNCAIIKPSSKVPHTSRFLASFIAELFPENEVALFEGSSAVSEELLTLKFDHIFFTGSTGIGRSVMEAASRHLTPLTLELGGKSPVIVDETADLRKAAERILWGKFVNAGQTCVAPDYLMIHESRLEEFLKISRELLEARFGSTPEARQASDSLCRLVSRGHLLELKTKLDAAVEAGARVEFGGRTDPETRYLEPTLLTRVTERSPIMQEEIFGPILPILTFRSLAEPVMVIQSREKPLALYIFSRSRSNQEYILAKTTAGGTSINSVMLHLANPELPFGGVGASGMGSYHGFHGFKSLSHPRAVLTQGPLDLLKFAYPPYTDKAKRMILRFLGTLR